MKTRLRKTERKICDPGAETAVIPIVSARLFDSTDLTIEADMLDRLMGAELAALFRNDR